MAMSIAGSQGELTCDMNTTPLIDVMLVLLIMFIITLPIMTHAVKLDMPTVKGSLPPTPPEVVDLELDADGTVIWNGRVVSSMAALESYFRSESVKESQPEIHLRPDRRVKYGSVAVVLASAQRNHMRKIGFVNGFEGWD